MEQRAFWSARTTHVQYLSELKKLVERAVKGEGYENDLPQLRLEARRLLRAFGYTAERGFPGDAGRGVPVGTPGTLTDLSSERRLNLIFDIQSKLARGLGQQQRGLARMDTFPAWELIRMETRAMPREWLERWDTAGDNVDFSGVYSLEGRMVAHKKSPIWAALGSSALFEDALDVDHAPFAFGSGMGLRETSLSDLSGVDMLAPLTQAETAAPDTEEVPEYIDPSDFIGGESTVKALLKKWKARRA